MLNSDKCWKYLQNRQFVPALNSITKHNCWDYTASPDKMLLMHQKRCASCHVTSQAGKHVVNVTGSFCNSTCESKRKITELRPGFWIRRRSLLLSWMCSWSVSTMHKNALHVTRRTECPVLQHIAVACEDDYLLQSITTDAELFSQLQLAPHSEHCLIYDDN